MSTKNEFPFRVFLSRALEEVITVSVEADSMVAAHVKAIDKALESDEWEGSLFTGDVKVERIEYSESNSTLYNLSDEQIINVEVITDIIRYSRFGALSQVFVMDAIAKHAKAVAEASEADLSGMNDGLAWKDVAREINQTLETLGLCEIHESSRNFKFEIEPEMHNDDIEADYTVWFDDESESDFLWSEDRIILVHSLKEHLEAFFGFKAPSIFEDFVLDPNDETGFFQKLETLLNKVGIYTYNSDTRFSVYKTTKAMKEANLKDQKDDISIAQPISELPPVEAKAAALQYHINPLYKKYVVGVEGEEGSYFVHLNYGFKLGADFSQDGTCCQHCFGASTMKEIYTHLDMVEPCSCDFCAQGLDY